MYFWYGGRLVESSGHHVLDNKDTTVAKAYNCHIQITYEYYKVIEGKIL